MSLMACSASEKIVLPFVPARYKLLGVCCVLGGFCGIIVLLFYGPLDRFWRFAITGSMLMACILLVVAGLCFIRTLFRLEQAYYYKMFLVAAFSELNKNIDGSANDERMRADIRNNLVDMLADGLLRDPPKDM